LLKDGLVHEAYAVDQENRREQLLKYSVKIASLESQLVAALQNQDGQLPANVALKTQQLQKMLDVEIPAAQLLASQTLIDADAELAGLQQQEITQDFETAEILFDEILPALLRDPTLDEILSRLENEQDFLERLGLSGRPSNLQIIGDWSRPGLGSSGSRLMSQLQQMRRLSNRAFRNALARTRVKNENRRAKLAKEDRRWNLLVSQLGDDMLQGDNKIPPERYRSAIEHYTDQISKLKSVQGDSE
jgi:hypothetical protein